ncbi:hypothetical protein CE91St56_49500 [Lachnospiraceae bacterium]|nr:hypothetical protein CE91St56_49500 [Lachnospiraceae bacterium]GKH43902.1 hypothetical protein CE91St57_48760 [Lachnospiraceae bacterium]
MHSAQGKAEEGMPQDTKGRLNGYVVPEKVNKSGKTTLDFSEKNMIP